jgi:drug/metabolite transporter (DMT)-like permease
LISATAWGGSDFVGGVGARRAPALLVVGSGHLVSLLVLLALCRGMHVAVPGHADLAYAALGGFEGSLALALFYRAPAMGTMGLTAALTGLLTALVPVVFSLLHDGLPTPLACMGLAAGCVAIWLITHSPSPKGSGTKAKPTPPAALLLGALAGVGFGTQLIHFQNGERRRHSVGHDLSARCGRCGTAAVFCHDAPKALWRGFWLTGIAAGTLDTLGNLFYIQATRFGRLDVAALICSLYPAGTILLAAMVLRERPTRRQMAGIGIALAAVVLLSV